MRNYLIIILATLVFATGPGAAAEQQLDGNGIKAALTGARAYWHVDSMYFKQSDFKAGGVLLTFHRRAGSHTGKWWVDGDKYCNQIGQGRKSCWTVFLDGQTIRMKSTDTGQTVTGRLVR